MRSTRRTFLVRAAQAGALGLALAALPPWLRDLLAQAEPGGAHGDLIERNAWPEHWETTVEALGRSEITPARALFVRSHLPVPELERASFRLEVRGRVERPLSISLAELEHMPATDLTCVLECAGNGRGLMALANTSGTQWGLGAVGNARWTGVSLRSLLERAGVAPEAKHIWFEAGDRGVLPGVPPFLRSIPIDVARGDVLLAYALNGAPLPRLHGAPLRVVVPGWYGMAWTKWVTSIRVEEASSDNHFMVRGYRYVVPGGDATKSPPVEHLRVKSLVTRPLAGARVRGGRLVVGGVAWAGPAGVRAVEISTDDGATWTSARLEEPKGRYAWRRWRAEVPAGGEGRLAILARATDGEGAVQPRSAAVNAAGYGNNSMHQVTVTVHG